MNRYPGVSAIVLVFLCGCQSLATTPAGAPVEKKVNINGISLAYIEQGQGAPVVFVHGAFSDLRAWEPQRKAIAQHFRFIAYTQRYFGSDAWPDKGEHYSQVSHAEDLAEFIRKLDAGPVYLVGRSYGGTVAVRMALQHPGLVRAVFVQEPTIAMTAVTSDEVRAALKKEAGGLAPVRAAANEGKPDEATRLFADWTNDQPGGFDALSTATQSMHFASGRTIALHFSAAKPPKITCADLGKMQTPLAITTGELTRPFFKILAETAHNCVPGSQLIVIPGARHAATSQNPAAFNDALVAFFSGH